MSTINIDIPPLVRNYYPATLDFIKRYNRIQYKIHYSEEDTTDDEDEFIVNLPIYLAHALIKDTGSGKVSRDELTKCAQIILDILI